MAERRMFAKTIIDSDAFLDMPLSAQALYFHLSMRADDEGFVNNPKQIQRMVGASEDDCKILTAKRFVLAFESGVIVIKHWRIHNYIQKDRFKETVYTKERAALALDKNNSYTEAGNVYKMDTKCIQPVSKLDTQYRLGKDRIEEEREIYKERETEKCSPLLPLKGKNPIYPPIEDEPKGEALKAFLAKYPKVIVDSCPPQLAEIDITELDEAFQKSSYLRDNPRELSFICKKYRSIIGGLYEDKTETKTAVEVEKETAAVKQSRRSEQFRIEDKIEADEEMKQAKTRLSTIELEIAKAEIHGDVEAVAELEKEREGLKSKLFGFLGLRDYKLLFGGDA